MSRHMALFLRPQPKKVIKKRKGGTGMYDVYYTPTKAKQIRRFYKSCQTENEMIQAVDKLLLSGKIVVGVMKNNKIYLYAAGGGAKEGVV